MGFLVVNESTRQVLYVITIAALMAVLAYASCQ